MFGFRKHKSDPDERHIFRYFDGQQDRAVDPLVPWERMWTDPDCDPKTDFAAAGRGELEATQKVYRCARRMFDLREYGEGGVTHDEAIRLLTNYMAYVEAIKKKRGPMPMPFRYLASASSRKTSGATKPDAGLSGTASESPGAEHSQSSRLSAVPLETA